MIKRRASNFSQARTSADGKYGDSATYCKQLNFCVFHEFLTGCEKLALWIIWAKCQSTIMQKIISFVKPWSPPWNLENQQLAKKLPELMTAFSEYNCALLREQGVFTKKRMFRSWLRLWNSAGTSVWITSKNVLFQEQQPATVTAM